MSKLDFLPLVLRDHLALDNSGYHYVSAAADLVDWRRPTLWAAVGMVLFNPIFWNVVARNEFHNKTLAKRLGPYGGCYVLAVSIFSLGILRDAVYQQALQAQPHHAALAHPAAKAAAAALFVLGQLFVVTSIYALGITGTYLGDYFGILMDARVTGFPFNVLEDPMYVGSTLAFLGTAIWYESPAGIAISGLVWVVYYIALQYEGPFTGMIYANKAKAAASSAPSTPRKSARLGKPATPAATGTSTATSYAAAAAAPPAANGEPSVDPAPIAQTPRRRGPRASVHAAAAAANGGAEASPMRVTRARSKARMSGSEED